MISRTKSNTTNTFEQLDSTKDYFNIQVYHKIRNRKAVRCDLIPAELIKVGGDEAVKVLTGICSCIWKKKIWPKDWKKSVFVPIYEKGDKKECGNY